MILKAIKEILHLWWIIFSTVAMIYIPVAIVVCAFAATIYHYFP